MAGETYTKRYGAGFSDTGQATPVDSQFLNAVEAALLRLLGEDPAADEVGIWTPGSGRFVFNKIANAQIASAAAIDKTKLGPLAIVDADVSGSAAISKSKLAALNIANADVAAAAAIVLSKLAITGTPDGTKFLRDDSSWQTVAQAMTLITDTTLGSDTASFDFTSIPGTYKHLLLVGFMRATTAANIEAGIMRFNNDSAGNYDANHFTAVPGGAPSVTSAQNNAQTSGYLGSVIAASARASRFSPLQILIPNYANSSLEKSYVSQLGYAHAAAQTMDMNASGAWRSTAAITRITILPSANNWKAGSRLSLYGVN